MKICTITCQNADNYGARLQTYALARRLQILGHEVEVIDYRPDYMTFRTRLFYMPKLSIKEYAKLILQYEIRKHDLRRHEAFEAFSQKYIPLSRKIYGSVEELKSFPPKADVYIAGSDQIWNTEFRNGTDPSFYLDFGNASARKISYAASFATPDLAKGSEKFVKRMLRNFDCISVREQSGVSMLDRLGFDGSLVVDPVFLLSAECWNELAQSPKHENRYVLVYDFLKSKPIEILARRLAKLIDCKIYSIGAKRLPYADRNFIKEDPGTFLGLIRNAECVVSNSLHGTLFAMIFHRDFFVVRRSDDLNERMTDWLIRCGLQQRLIDETVSDDGLKEHIDYESVDAFLKREIQYSESFLENAIAGMPHSENMSMKREFAQE